MGDVKDSIWANSQLKKRPDKNSTRITPHKPQLTTDGSKELPQQLLFARESFAAAGDSFGRFGASSTNPASTDSTSIPSKKDAMLSNDCIIRGPQDFDLPFERPTTSSWSSDFDPDFFNYHLSENPHNIRLSHYLDRAPQHRLAQRDREFKSLLFYIVAHPNIELLRKAIQKGCDINSTMRFRGLHMPLLVFTVIQGFLGKTNVHNIISVLLGAGAKVTSQIPPCYYTTTTTAIDPDMHVPEMPSIGREWNWCLVLQNRKDFESGLDTYIRHCFKKASLSPVKSRDFQIAKLRNAEPLMQLPYSLVGQSLGIARMYDILMDRLLSSESQPLVIMFAGPSGHGKTELASRIGSLLNIDIIKIDCASGKSEYDFFGVSGQMVGGDRGTPLNNFLAAHNGKDGIVLLDEFEKTAMDVHNSFLNIFGSGEYKDRRNNAQIDCSRTIWVLTTNHFDRIISDFYKKNKDMFEGPKATFQAQQACYEELIHTLRKGLGTNAPSTGRLTDFVPFLPFSHEEQIVGIDKLLTEYVARARLPIHTSEDYRLFGDVELSLIDRLEIAKAVAADAYIPDLGMRSLNNAMRTKVARVVHSEFRGIKKDIKESSSIVKMSLELLGGRPVAKVME